MTKNVGNIDRILRVVVGLALLASLAVLEGSARWLGLIGVVLLVTGVFSFCPAYRLINLNTCGKCCAKEGCGKED
jgi:hypothetical protein